MRRECYLGYRPIVNPPFSTAADGSSRTVQSESNSRYTPAFSYQVPQFLLEILKALLLGFHLLAIGLAAAGPIFCLLLAWRTSDTSPAFRMGRQLAWLSVGGMVVGMALGSLALLLPPDLSYWEVLQTIPEKDYWFAGTELAFSLLCLVVYAATWNRLRAHRIWHGLIALLSVTNLLYHFPPLMIVIGQLADGSAQLNTAALDRATLLKLMLRGEVVAPWLHFTLATCTIAGGTALWLLSNQYQQDETDAELVRPAQRVAGSALLAGVLQLPLGLWLLTTISQSSRAAIMGKSALASLLFLAAMLCAFLLLGRLGRIALGEFVLDDLRKAVLWTVLVVLAMAMSSRTSRIDALKLQAEVSKEMGHEESTSMALR